MTAQSVIIIQAEDLSKIIEDAVNKALSDRDKPKNERKIIYGLPGIAETMGVGITTAWRMKKEGVFDGYISQVGSSITAYEDDIIQAGKEYFKKTTKKEKTIKVKSPYKLKV